MPWIYISILCLLGSLPRATYAVPVSYIERDYTLGRSTFRNILETSASSTMPSVFVVDMATYSGGASNFTVTSGSSTVYVKTEKSGLPASNDSIGDQGGRGYTNWSVPSFSTWSAAEVAGYKISFYSDLAFSTPYLVNAVGIQVNDWGTAGFGANITPDGTYQQGSSIYMKFESTDDASTLRAGTYLSSVGQLEQFVGAVDDSGQFSSVTLVPNGAGEYFGVGSYLMFSTVALNSVGSMPNIIARNNPHLPSGIGVDFNPVFEGGTLLIDSNQEVSNNFSIKNENGWIDPNGHRVVLSGVLSDHGSEVGGIGVGSGLGGIGSGEVILTGQNSYSGPTRIGMGYVLSLQGMNNLIASSEVINSGVMNLLSAPNSVSLPGNYSQESTGRLLINFSPAGTQQKLLVGGSVSLSGALHLLASPGHYSAGRYEVIISNSAGISTDPTVLGEFSALESNLSMYANHSTELEYDNQKVYVVLVPSVADTLSSLGKPAVDLSNYIVRQMSSLALSLRHDCDRFGSEQLCFRTGGSVSNTADSTLDLGKSFFATAYKKNEWEFGVWFEKENASKYQFLTVGEKRPSLGFWAEWHEYPVRYGGWDARISVSHSEHSIALRRPEENSAEAANASTHGYGMGVEFQLGRTFVVEPVAATGEVIPTEWYLRPYVSLTQLWATLGAYQEQGNVFRPLSASKTQSGLTKFSAGVNLLTSNYYYQLGSVAWTAEAEISYAISQRQPRLELAGITGIPTLFLRGPVNQFGALVRAGLQLSLSRDENIYLGAQANRGHFSNDLVYSVMASYQIGR